MSLICTVANRYQPIANLLFQLSRKVFNEINDIFQIIFFDYTSCAEISMFYNNHNYQLNWWFTLALKGPYASSVSRRTEKVCQPHDFLRLRLKALFYYLLFLATRERVDIFFHTYLVICDVLLQLISDVLFYRFFVSPNCIYIISSTPEMSISIFIF